MFPHPILLALVFIAFLLIIRNHWLTYRIERHLFQVGYYCRKTDPGSTTFQELCQIWPAQFMLFEIWRWDFNRYVVWQDHLMDMERYIQKDLARNDLDWADFNVSAPSLVERNEAAMALTSSNSAGPPPSPPAA